MEGRKFKTLLPQKKYMLDEIINSHPYTGDSVCNSCRYRHVCVQASEKLPLIILEKADPYLEHECTKVGIVGVYLVAPYKGKVENSSEKISNTDETEKDLYLLDANIMINAINRDKKYGAASRWVMNTEKIRRCTTDLVLKEVRNHDKKIMQTIDCTFKVRKKDIDHRLLELKAGYRIKQPSLQDISLIQAAVDHEDVKGIITFDTDFKNTAAAGVIRLFSGRKVEILTPFELQKKINRPKKRRYKSS